MRVFSLTQFVLAAPDAEANDRLQPLAEQPSLHRLKLSGGKGAISSIPNAFISSNLTGSQEKIMNMTLVELV